MSPSKARKRLAKAIAEQDVDLLRESIAAGDHLRYWFGGMPAIIAATICGFDEGIDMLVAGGMSPSTADKNTGETALHWAATLSTLRLSSLKRLVALKADVNAKDNEGATPLDCARWANNTEGVEALKDAGARHGVMVRLHGPAGRPGHRRDSPEDRGR